MSTDPREALIAFYLGLILLAVIVVVGAVSAAAIWRAITNSARVLDEPPGYLTRER